MDAETPIVAAFDCNMTTKGQVLIPKAMRDRAGLVPGHPVRVRLSESNEVIVAPRPSEETREERRARIRAALAAASGSIATGFATTDEYMAFIRPRPDDL